MFSEKLLGLHSGFLPEWIRCSWRKINIAPSEEPLIWAKTEMGSQWGGCRTGRTPMETVSVLPYLPCRVLAFCSAVVFLNLSSPYVHRCAGTTKHFTNGISKTDPPVCLFSLFWSLCACVLYIPYLPQLNSRLQQFHKNCAVIHELHLNTVPGTQRNKLVPDTI